MEGKNQDFSREARRLAQTPEGQQLIRLLQQADQSQLQQAASQAQAGNFGDAQKTLAALLSNPEAQQLLKKLGGK